ncbi:MAG TPA: cysteine hydrolase [Acidimicrobiales bacterium]|nr:cysteine hydrolase [Acidimicrobiales bacterium]
MPRPVLRDLVAPGHTALVLQEVQRGVLGDESALPQLAASARESGAIANIARLVTAARAASVPVLHATAASLPGRFGANHNARLFGGVGGMGEPSSTAALPLPEVGPEPGDIVLPRFHGLSPMTGTQMDAVLRNEGVTTIVAVGVSLNVAIVNLTFDAVNRAYQVVVVRDAVAGVPQGYGEQVLDNTLSLVSTVVTTDDVVAAWSA